MPTKYYNNLFEIEDGYRKNKYYKLLLCSLQNDLNKWTVKAHESHTRYQSPDYNGSYFVLECHSSVSFAFIAHYKFIIKDRSSELITDDFSSELKKEIDKLRANVFTSDIQEIEKLIGNKNDRKDKLQFFEIEQLKSIIEDSYQDWLKDSTEQTAEWIAKLMYSYRKKEEYYNIWIEKFGNVELIINELNKIK